MSSAGNLNEHSAARAATQTIILEMVLIARESVFALARAGIRFVTFIGVQFDDIQVRIANEDGVQSLIRKFSTEWDPD